MDGENPVPPQAPSAGEYFRGLITANILVLDSSRIPDIGN